MVTGIETVGLVLAIFPLLVSGLEHYAEGVETIKTWRRYRRELAGYARQLETQRVWYLDTLAELLDFVQSEGDLKAMMNDPGGPLWQQPKYDELLKARLDHSYKPYIDTIKAMLEALDVVKQKLGLSASAGKLPWNDLSTIEREVKRIKLVLSKSTYAVLLGQIDKANKDLREFTHQNRHLEPIRQKRRASKHRSTDFKRIRRHARSLHNVVVGGRCWKCVCLKDHRVNLRLEVRHNTEEESTTSLRFRVRLSIRYADQQMIQQWHELEVESIDSAPALDTAAPTIPTVHGQAGQGKKKVGFVVPMGTAQMASQGTPMAAMTVPTHSVSNDITAITDICTALHKECSNMNHQVKKCIGFLADDKTSGSDRHCLYMLDARAPTSPEPVSLETLLTNSSPSNRRRWRPPGGIITRHDRLYLAATFASSVLQLDGSWLTKQWRSKDIMFVQNEGAEADYLSPYITWKVHEETPITATPTNVVASRMAHLIRSEVLFALGLTLIELCFGQTLADMQVPEDVHPSNEASTNFETGHRLLDYVYDESGTRYGDVVRRCLSCPFDVRDASLDNDDFQALVFEHIVTPLTDDLKDFEGNMRIR